MSRDVIRELGYLTLGTRLKRLGERMQAHTQRVLDAHGLQIVAAQFPFLAALDRLGPLKVGELAEAVGVTQPAATKTIGQLVEAGYVAISTTSDDQRKRSVDLTKLGRRLVAEGQRSAWPLVEAAVEELCHRSTGPLLEQLAAIEDALSEAPLDVRAAAVKGRRS
jgi:DNA-binding MarR family transcriptional regulator